MEDLAKTAWDTYSESVGGVAFNGEPLPTWREMTTDPAKVKLVQAWRATAEAIARKAGGISSLVGLTVKDKITNLQGVVICETFWLNGCVRVGVQPRELLEGKIQDRYDFDIEQVDLVPGAPTFHLGEPGGGPMPKATRPRAPAAR